MLKHTLSSEEYAFWIQNLYLLIPQALSAERAALLMDWTQEVADWPESPGQWMKYFETPEGGDLRQLCRVENVVQHHTQMNALIRGEGVLNILEQLMGEPAQAVQRKN